MQVTFKCNATGNIVTFKDAVDIESMRIHPEYTEVVVEEPTEPPVVTQEHPTEFKSKLSYRKPRNKEEQ